MILTAPPREKRVVNRSFILASLFQVGATIGDIETTQYGLSHGHKEGNPLFGSAPSRKLQYAVAVPVAGVVVGWSYRLKKSAPHSKYWLIPQLVIGTIHTAALSHNLGPGGSHGGKHKDAAVSVCDGGGASNLIFAR